MVDVVRNDRAPASDFIADKFRRDQIGDARAPALRAFAVGGDQLFRHFAAQVLTLCHIFHFRRDDALAGIVHLADVRACLCAKWPLHHIGEGWHTAGAVRPQLAIVFRLHFACVILLDIAACHDPFAAQRGQAGIDVDICLGVCVRAGGVIDPNRRLIALQIDLSHRHANAGARARANVDLAAAANGASGNANFDGAVDVGHNGSWSFRECIVQIS